MESVPTVEESKRCKRGGCAKHYTESQNSGIACKFHPGKPIFHDIKKGWECCGAIVYDWESFEKIVGCQVGPHSADAE